MSHKVKRTAAHWGSYVVTDGPAGLKLSPDPGDPNPSIIGTGWLSAMQDRNVRIHRPAVRRGWLNGDRGARRNDDAFVEVSWDKATELVASEVTRVAQQHGNDAIFGGSYGWASAGRFHHAHSQLGRFLTLAGGCCSSRDTYSHAAAEVLLPHVVGVSNRVFQDQMTSWPLVAEHCELFLAFGGVTVRTAQITSSGTSVHEVGHWLKTAAERGMRTVNISPQRTGGDDVPGAEWLSLRPGTDTALMLALAFEIHRAGGHDEAYLDRYTSGWPVFRAYLTGETDGVAKSAAWASPICDVPEDDIRALAHRMIGKRVMINVSWGLQRADHGEQPIWMGLTLAAMLGSIGKPGTGFGFGYGAMTSVGRPERLIRWPSVPQGRNPVKEFVPVARATDMLLNPGGSYTYNGETRRYPKIRLIYWVGGNPFHHQQDLHRLSDAWTRPETVIVHDHSWTATARRADIVLPCTSPLERDDIMINRRDPALIYMSKIKEPIGEALSDHGIFRRIAAHMGLEEGFCEGRNEQDWLRWLWAGCQGVAQKEGFRLPDFDTFREGGRFDIPDGFVTRIQLSGFVDDPDGAPLQTESGKITIHNEWIDKLDLNDCPGHPTWMPPVEWLGDADADQLHLISGQPLTRLHGQLDNGDTSAATKINGREPCVLHPDTAALYGIREGDIVRISNERGSCLAGARLDDGTRRDCIALATGAWFDPQEIDGRQIEVHGNPNVLTIDKGTSGLAQGCIGHTALVRIECWTGPVPAISVHKQPRFSA